MARKIGVLRMLPGLGDFLCLLPALRTLRHGEPDADIRLIGLPAAEPLVSRFPEYLNGLVPVPYFPGLTPPTASATSEPVLERLHEVQEEGFDLILQHHGSGLISNPLAELLAGGRTAGFYLPGQYRPNPARFIPYPADLPEIRRHLALLEHLGYPPQGEHLEFPQTDADRAEADELREAHDLEAGGYVVLHPGASEPGKRWPADRFAAIGNVLASQGYRVVLTGEVTEKEITASVAHAMRHDPVDLAGLTTLGSLAALLCGARLLVTNDTGISHLASACVTPSVVIFTGDPRTGATAHRWAPLNRERHIAIEPRPARNEAAAGDQEDLHCPADVMERCLRDGCTLPARRNPEPLGKVSVSDVQRAVERLLGRRP